MAGTQPAGCQKFRESRKYNIFPGKFREIPRDSGKISGNSEKSRDFSGKPRGIPEDFRKIPGNSMDSRKSPRTQEMFRKFSHAQHASGQGECVKTFVFLVFSAQKIFRKFSRKVLVGSNDFQEQKIFENFRTLPPAAPG